MNDNRSNVKCELHGAPHVTVTARDEAILHALVHCVKLLSIKQVARTWWHGSSQSSPRKRLAALSQAGLVRAIQLLASDEVPLAGPVSCWRPGDAAPDFFAVSRMARQRWRASVRPTACVVATPLSALRLGGVVRESRMSEATHDLHVAQVYLVKLSSMPLVAARWEGERCRPDLPPRTGDKVPDAIVHSAGRSIAIEIVGESYTAQKLFRFHEYCNGRRLEYELW